MGTGAVAEPLSGEELLRRRVRTFVRQHPLASVAAATGLGLALGGVLFCRLGRLFFMAAAGYVANGLVHHDGRMNVPALFERLQRT
jgi:hypothetical protein